MDMTFDRILQDMVLLRSDIREFRALNQAAAIAISRPVSFSGDLIPRSSNEESDPTPD